MFVLKEKKIVIVYFLLIGGDGISTSMSRKE